MITAIIPSIIATSQEELDTLLEKVPFAERIHLDVMDGEFVDSASLQFDFSIKSDAHKEAHLMIADPSSWIEKHADKVDTIIIHAEATEDLEEAISSIKKKGKNVGVAINPKTPIESLFPVIHDLDHVLVMTVNPGAYGAEFLPETLDKVKSLREKHQELDIEVDGGMGAETVARAKEAGANLFVSGSYIIHSEAPEGAYNTLKEVVQ